MDTRTNTNVFVAKNCTRTSNVQVWDPTATSTYIGKGELAIGDETGVIYANAAAVTDVNKPLVIYQREKNGDKVYRSEPMYANQAVSYRGINYVAPVQQAVGLSSIDATLTSHTYILRIRDISDSCNQMPRFKPVAFQSSSSGNTLAEIIDGFVAAINAQFANDLAFPVEAVNENDVVLVVKAKALPYSVGKYEHKQFRFTVEAPTFDATITDTLASGQTYGITSYDQATTGSGSYMEATDMDWASKINFFGRLGRNTEQPYETTPLPLDTEQYQSDGSTDIEYDVVGIDLVTVDGVLAQSARLQHSVSLLLDTEDNATSQVENIRLILNKYFVTLGDLDAAITLT